MISTFESKLPNTYVFLQETGGDGTREAENMGFFEPHVLSLVLWELRHNGKRTDRQGEMCGSKNCMFLSPVLWEKV
jgi:hypothetical protein